MHQPHDARHTAGTLAIAAALATIATAAGTPFTLASYELDAGVLVTFATLCGLIARFRADTLPRGLALGGLVLALQALGAPDPTPGLATIGIALALSGALASAVVNGRHRGHHVTPASEPVSDIAASHHETSCLL